MIFVYSDEINSFELSSFDKNELIIVDNNYKKFYKGYKNFYKNFNYIKCIKKYNDIKYNIFYSCYNYYFLNNYNNNISIIFDIKKTKKDHENYFECIISFPKRRFIKNILKETPCPKKLVLNKNEIKEIIFLSNFLIKSKIISPEKSFFDFVYNYYFYLNEKRFLIQ